MQERDISLNDTNDLKLNQDEAAEYLHLRPSTIQNYMNQKKLPDHRTEKDRTIWFWQSELDQYLTTKNGTTPLKRDTAPIPFPASKTEQRGHTKDSPEKLEEGESLFIKAAQYILTIKDVKECISSVPITSWKIKVQTANGPDTYFVAHDPESITEPFKAIQER